MSLRRRSHKEREPATTSTTIGFGTSSKAATTTIGFGNKDPHRRSWIRSAAKKRALEAPANVLSVRTVKKAKKEEVVDQN